MNEKILACLLAGAIGGLALQASAQQTTPGAPPSAPSASQQALRESHDADRQLAHLTKRLKLNIQQQDEIKPILQDREHQMRNLRQDDTVSRAVRGERARSIMEESNTKIEAFLDNAQKRKFEKDQEAMQRNMNRRDDDNSFEDSPPPPDDGGGPPDGGPPPDDRGGPPDGGPPGW